MTSSWRLVQLTDLHLLADDQALFKGVDSRRQFLQGLDLATSLAPDYLLLTGDLAQDEKAETYQWLVEQLQASGLKWLWLPGNHDAPELMQNWAEPGFWQQGPIWQLLGLDSRQPGKASGYLPEAQLLRLDQALMQPRPLLLALHHHPLAVGSRWMDAIALENADAFWQRLQLARSPVVVVCGHVHQTQTWQHQGVKVYSTPSTALQFAPGKDEFMLDYQAAAGLRCLDLYADGQCRTWVENF
ncbi:metallophosphoesterase [Marinospirillum perlucidum]|uniref:metallophosphoesterase n=1 Tax=Marinospirillum perlucidum TaxID=1982602 RepID=UPI000DF114C6|nr:metallophosphoesterase [Marinospirillum perlucidum]